MSGRTVPIVVLTGFLGAGKTTLLGRLLADPRLVDTAVLINEWGEVAIDHHLVRAVRGDVVVLGGGCVCCVVQGDLVKSLMELYTGVTRGELPRFQRVLLETSGLADPSGAIAAVLAHPLLSQSFHIGAVVAAVDGVLGLATLAEHREAVTQVALADRVIITKADVAEDLDAVAAAIADINPGALQIRSAGGAVDPEALLAPAPGAGDPARLRAWLDASGAYGHADDHVHGPDCHHGHHRHGEIASFSVIIEKPVRLGPLAMWLSLMTQMDGARLLRIKGVVHVEGAERPSVIHSVQHLAYPAEELAAWPDDDRSTRIVFITRGMSDDAVRRLRESLLDTLGVAIS
jgi:G3E family GTPase